VYWQFSSNYPKSFSNLLAFPFFLALCQRECKTAVEHYSKGIVKAPHLLPRVLDKNHAIGMSYCNTSEERKAQKLQLR
jgi:hypothetical protein